MQSYAHSPPWNIFLWSWNDKAKTIIYIFTFELIFQDKSILEIIQDPEG